MRFEKRMYILGGWLLGISLMLVACGGGATQEPVSPEEPATAIPTAEPTSEPMLENSLTVGDQAVSDDVSVTIAGAVSEGPGWMVVHADADGAPGPVIGFAPVNEGENEDVAVKLDPSGLTGVLYAMLHVDAGAEGEYEFPGDDVPARDEAGDIVVTPFSAYWNAVEVSGQELMAGDQVTVERVISRTPGWLVVHAEAEGGPGPVIGHAPVSMGENLEVAVQVDAERLTGTLFAMLHVDADTEGEYEFPGDDVPARTPEGDVAVVPFTLTANAVNVPDQALGEGNTIQVSNVLSRTPGWLVVHADEDGSPGMILGFSPVDEGETTDVLVELDADGITETMFAMLHVDEGSAGEFEFPGGEDVPARDPDGDIVTPPFQLLQEDMSAEEMNQVVVEIQDNRFAGDEITVPVGTTVVWEQVGSFAHTVTADDRSFDSGTMRDGSSFSHTFDEPGSYPYFCEFHGAAGGVGMSGVVIVTE